MPLSEDVKKILDQITDSGLKTKIQDELAALTIGESEKTRKQNEIDLYKLEYETAAERYENIYKAIWTNFSYMSVVAGAILTFGSNFYPNATLIAFLSCLPLLFWYYATFIPMNRYGYKAVGRLAEIEELLNDEFKTQLDHYKNFGSRRTPGWQRLLDPRVGPAMLIFSSVLLIFAICFGYRHFSESTALIQQGDLKVTDGIILQLKKNDKKIESNLADQPKPASINPNPTISPQPSPSPRDIYEIIRGKLSTPTQKLLDETNPGAPSKELQRNLILDFNNLINGPPLYNETKDKLNNEVKKREMSDLIEKADTSEKLMQAHRHLLHLIFPGEVSLPTNFSWSYLILLPLLLIVFRFWIYEFNEQILKPIIGQQNRIKLLTITYDSDKKAVVGVKLLRNLDDLKNLRNKRIRILEIPSSEAAKWVATQPTAEILALVEEKDKITPRILNFEKAEDILKRST